MKYNFPVSSLDCPGVPINFHPGAFGFHRRVNYHSGVDLYCKNGTFVHPVEDGIVVSKGKFTGPDVGTPWWNTTYYLMIQGNTGVFLYGEIYEPVLEIGTEVTMEEYPVIGVVKQVLFDDRYREDIPHHSTAMLHIELYKHGTNKPCDWQTYVKPAELLDPTPFLIYPYAATQMAPPPVSIPNSLNAFQWDNSNGRTVG